MRKYIDKESVHSSIKYFESNSMNAPEQLGLFFFFKSLDINTWEYMQFKKASQMSENQKKVYNENLYTLSSVFAEDEHGEKRTCLFPFSIQKNIKQKQFYNGGSTFKQLLSRITDTVDNTLVDKFLDKADNDTIKLKRNYLSYIKEEYLSGNKISLVNLSIWICRFIGFEVDDDITQEQFTRLCVKYTLKYLNINEKELQEIFYDDHMTNKIKYNDIKIEGAELRALIDFTDKPEVKKKENHENNEDGIIINIQNTRRLIELNDKNPSSEEIKNILMLKKQIILYGVPGIGKSRFISSIENEFDEVVKIQFHPNTTYEDFIGGSTIQNGNIVTKAGKFLKMCNEAEQNSDKKYLFVIDEINRGNIAKIFGETILALDREYTVGLIKSININNKDVNEFRIPSNLFIIGTMNSADRSIAVLDYAIRRRFGFIKLQPNYEVIKELSNIEEIKIDISKLFKSLNDRIKNTLGEEELMLGQAYFLSDFVHWVDGKVRWTSESLRLVFNYSIIPILEEYTYGNTNDLASILGDKISTRIYDNDEFIEEIKSQFPEIVE